MEQTFKENDLIWSYTYEKVFKYLGLAYRSDKISIETMWGTRANIYKIGSRLATPEEIANFIVKRFTYERP